MSYTITVTNNSPITIATGASDSSTALTLIGKNFPSYGQIIGQNFVNLMQNFASTDEPNGVLDGQLWYDTSSGLLKLWNGTSFKVLSSISSQTTTPTTGEIGDFWWDTANSQLKIYNSTNWVTVGPYDTVGAVVLDTIADNSNNDRSMARITVGGVNVAAISGATFTARSSYAGFTNIIQGISISGGLLVTGTATLTASSARYADLAEYYTSDEEYEAGTVVMIGGAEEVTAANILGTTKVVGVVSANPAYLMNSECEGVKVAVALQGRIPCKVIGRVERGDTLIASNIPGVAISIVNANAGSIIGKALQSHDEDGAGIIEIVAGKH
jgi:hypothetical protein